MQQRVNRSLELVKLLITVTGNDIDGAGNPFSRDLLQSMETDKQGLLASFPAIIFIDSSYINRLFWGEKNK